MAKGPKPQDVHGVYWRDDREAWAARYKINGKLVRKIFGPNPEDRGEAIAWLEDVRSLKRKEGADALPVSATAPILTMAEKKALLEEKANRITLGELCDDLKDYIAKHPTQYKDQLNPPRRLDRIKADLGDRPAAGIKPKEIEAWLDGLTNAHAQRGRGKLLSDASVIHVKKSKNGMERYIPMLPEVLDAFKTIKSLGLKRKDRAEGQPNESPKEACFALVDPKKWWAAVLKEAKVKHYRWHDNRHSFCSRLVQAGKSLKVVQELAGHRDIKTTARYAHLDQGSKLEAMKDAFKAA